MGAVKEMNKREQLLRDGYCVVENVLDNSMLNKLRDVTNQLLQKQSLEDQAKQRSTGSMISVMSDPLFADLVAWPNALSALENLGYPIPKFSSGYIISKPPYSPRLFWHYDYACWDDPDAFGEVPQQLFLMYYLVDTTPNNGCIRVVPGTHIQDNPLFGELMEAHTDKLTRAENLDLAEFSTREDEIDVPIKAGDLLIGDSRLLHASHENLSDQRRTVITLWYHPDMEALSEPVQAFISQRAPNEAPEHWPKKAKETLSPLLAVYNGKAEPLSWNRNRPLKK